MLKYLPVLIVMGVFGVAALESQVADGVRGVLAKIRDPFRSTTVDGFVGESRRDRRPKLTGAEYEELASVLRDVYSGSIEAWPKPQLDEGVLFEEMGLVGEVDHPKDNPTSREKVLLGKRLFFDGRLSGMGQMSCASCHIADLGWADGRARSLGHGAGQLARNTPTMLNSAFSKKQFWDGRAETLEELVVAVLTNPDEMSNSPEQVVETVQKIKGYREQIKDVFGEDKVTIEVIAKSIATYVRSVVSDGSSQFDKFLAGKQDALSDSELRGLHLFRTDARCMNCHSGPLLTDQGFHNLGLVYYGRKYEDLGRYNVTGEAEDVGRFKTPSLRNVGRTMPLTHTGFFDVRGMLNMYNAGMVDQKVKPGQEEDPLLPMKDVLLKPLHLNDQDLDDLEAFLRTLTERRRRDMMPVLPE
ncbi:Cytochrome c551 peroxidase precursor [Poriferisphaera corsica]|uniref:Methylamine utilization protein MauG n=1 Tax=Poriferisphaera corsica TaxID=2528020 RepID=A0A517YT27_9BACT|nr:cytochrome c peroxidase [Poriferisphaera corsica]QDU33393.1 Cytochrome c551 peroxidase precursor [Poriferisphaera corsica]